MSRFNLPRWPLRLERRSRPSSLMRIAAAPLAVLALLVVAALCIRFSGREPAATFRVLFVEPFASLYGIGELLLKATPLMLCAIGLSVGYRANVWNIGAEGQFVAGALGGGGVALFGAARLGVWTWSVMVLAGVLGGMAWAAIPALLRTRFRTNEIFVSLMLVYIAQLLLAYLVHGPWRDPAGQNFPQSQPFGDGQLLAPLADGARVNAGFLVALSVAAFAWWFSSTTAAGFRLRVGGLAPAAARYAGISEAGNVWLALMVSGAAAGLAGLFEVAGPIGMLQPVISPGYGFAAIIVAFVGRLHPVGIVLSSLLIAALYLGGEAAQIELKLPAAVSGVFQAVLLFLMLAAELFVAFRVRRARPTLRAERA